MAQLTLRDGIEVLQGRALFARTTLWIYMSLTLALIASWMTVLAAGIDQDAAPDQPALIAAGVVSLVWVLAFAACMVSVCMWVYRAHANLFAAELDGLEFTPAWSVGWFFVPFAFWFKPFQAMRELWNASHLLADDEAAPTERRLTIWGGAMGRR
ncbi:DUF4328 domain-containing protein [Novosphingobium kaempferiae]|uniref:DUF4328 domain-containing protein n=1 Tax=Novosphingobium kaempferiae TaxID=2896849 RepID=UPI001E42D495|nr:DUF4328 domain-containing protein [Novosphingobium kaempferiae]